MHDIEIVDKKNHTRNLKLAKRRDLNYSHHHKRKKKGNSMELDKGVS